jgi:RND superfamily putative drug exporter
LLAVRWRWPLLVVPILIALACVPLATRVADRVSTGGWIPSNSDSTTVDGILDEEFGRRTTTHYILFRDPSGILPAADPRFRREVERLVRPLRNDPEVISLSTWGTTGNDLLDSRLISDDGMMSIAIVNLNQDIHAAASGLDRLMGLLESDLIEAQVGGWPATTAALQDLTRADLARAEWITVPLSLVLLFLAFGGLLAASLPILIALASLIVTFAIITVMSRYIETSIFAINVVTMIGIAVGVDYALILISRYREEARRHPLDEALAITMATAGRATIVSGLAVAIGLVGLIAFGVPAAISTGLAGATIVLFSVLLSLTMLPALLAILGDRITRPARSFRLPGFRSLPWSSPHARRLRDIVAIHPALVLAVSGLLLLGLAAPVLDMDASSPTIEILPASADARQMHDTAAASFSSTSLSPITIIVEPRRGRMTSSRNLDELRAFTERVAAMEGVRGVTSVWTFIPGIPGSGLISGGLLIEPRLRDAVAPYLTDRAAVVEIGVDGDLRDVTSERIVADLRANALALTDGRFHLIVGGDTAANRDLIDHVRTRTPMAIGLVVLVTWLILFVQFRSLLLPVKAILLNMLSLAASFGALVWIFQEGHGHQWLRFEPTGYTVVIVPIVMFCFMFGLSMDYEVIMLSRIREAWLASGDNAAAIATGLRASAGIVTSAALVMLVVFLTFGTSELQIIKAMGIGLALAVLIDATLIRLLVLPAAMRLMGRWNWWVPSVPGLSRTSAPAVSPPRPPRSIERQESP